MGRMSAQMPRFADEIVIAENEEHQCAGNN